MPPLTFVLGNKSYLCGNESNSKSKSPFGFLGPTTVTVSFAILKSPGLIKSPGTLPAS